MRRLAAGALLCPVLALLLAAAGSAGMPEASTRVFFRPVDEIARSGQSLVMPRPLYLTRKPSAKLAVEVPPGATVLYGSLDGTAIAEMRRKDGSAVFDSGPLAGKLTAETTLRVQ